MLTKIWFRGLRASGYLVVRSLKAMVLLAALPISLLVGWAFPGGTASLVRLANNERSTRRGTSVWRRTRRCRRPPRASRATS